MNPFQASKNMACLPLNSERGRQKKKAGRKLPAFVIRREAGQTADRVSLMTLTMALTLAVAMTIAVVVVLRIEVHRTVNGDDDGLCLGGEQR